MVEGPHIDHVAQGSPVAYFAQNLCLEDIDRPDHLGYRVTLVFRLIYRHEIVATIHGVSAQGFEEVNLVERTSQRRQSLSRTRI